jgi:tRNA (cytidine/uridine-2'-O-)-methyltransferase
MFHIIMYQPEIPPNTGNVIRLCANAGAELHLIHPLGFSMDEPRLRRAGLDYHELTRVTEHPDLDDCLTAFDPARVFAVSTRGAQAYQAVTYRAGDAFLLGPETRGLPEHVLARFPAEQRLRIPMWPGNRSLNLSNAAAVLVYEAWRQLSFAGGA